MHSGLALLAPSGTALPWPCLAFLRGPSPWPCLSVACDTARYFEFALVNGDTNLFHSRGEGSDALASCATTLNGPYSGHTSGYAGSADRHAGFDTYAAQDSCGLYFIWCLINPDVADRPNYGGFATNLWVKSTPVGE